MPQISSSIVEFLRAALHARYDTILSEPLPARWADVIRHLNDQERDAAKVTQARGGK
jgi:hypothetical protein